MDFGKKGSFTTRLLEDMLQENDPMTLFSNYWLKLVIDFSIIQKVDAK